VRFGVFAENWFLWDECDYLKRKRARGSYNRSYADQQRAHLKNHILPEFENTKLSKISVRKIESWLLDNRDKSSATNANRVLSVFKVMLKEAVRLGYLPKNPADHVTKLQEIPKEKGILSLDEVRKLLDPKNLKKCWGNNLFQYCFNAIAATTGMRMGEIMALKIQDFHEDYFSVVHSWDRKYGLKEPKTGSKRLVSIPASLGVILTKYVAGFPTSGPEQLLFAGLLQGVPIDHKVVAKRFGQALKIIGISEELRKERNITFHSWRHFFNTFMRGKVSDAELQKITGHQTLTMTEHYDHQQVGELKKIRTVQNSIFLEKKTATKKASK
jgi:integrase